MILPCYFALSKIFVLIIANNSSAPDLETEEATIPVEDLPR